MYVSDPLRVLEAMRQECILPDAERICGIDRLLVDCYSGLLIERHIQQFSL
jgi:hypothetical protein